MLRKPITYLLLVAHLANMGCSNLPVPLPEVVEDVFPGVAQDVASDLAIRQVASIWKDDIPIERTEHTFYPTVERLPGAEFTPTPLPSNLEDNTPIAPGDYEIPAHFYCTGHYMRNGSGYRYRLAKLEGKFSEALTQLYVRASQAGIFSSTMQVLSWSLQAGVAYEDLGSLERALVDRLIPEYRAQMQLGFTEKLMRDWDTWSSRMPAPSFNETLTKMGDVGAYIRTLMDARREIINKDYNYHALASVFVTESDAPVPTDPEKTPWGRIHDRIFMRFIAPQGAVHDGVIQMRILDGYSQSPQASLTTAVTAARPNHGADACALSGSLNCNQGAFGDIGSFTRSSLAQVSFGRFQASRNLAPTLALQQNPLPEITILPRVALRVPVTGAILWETVIVLLLAVIAVSSAAQSLTATVNTPSRGSEPRDPGQEKPTFTDCSEDQKAKIQDGIKDAKRLSARAIIAFERRIPLSFEAAAMTAHFGGRDESDTIIQKYKAVIDNAEKKAYKCVKSTKPKQKHLCAQGECPGKSVLVLPQFAGKACPAGPTILHEAIHNAGACGDIDRDGKKYPPSKSEDNAWSYEYFASEVDAGAPTPKLPDGTPKAPR